MQRPTNDSLGGAPSAPEFLAQSENRVTVLRELAANGRMDRYELEDGIDVTRRTILRTVNALEERGYVDETDAGIGLTALGEYIIEHYDAFLDRVTMEPSVEQFMASLPADSLDVDVDRLRAGEVTAAAPGSPYAPLDRSLELRAQASEIRELAPGIERRSVEQLADRVETDEDVNVEIVITEDVLAAAEEAAPYTDAHETVLAADAVDMAVHPGPFEVALGVADDVVFVVAEGADGQPNAILETDDAKVRQWAEGVIDRYQAAATPLDLE